MWLLPKLEAAKLDAAKLEASYYVLDALKNDTMPEASSPLLFVGLKLSGQRLGGFQLWRLPQASSFKRVVVEYGTGTPHPTSAQPDKPSFKPISGVAK
ncbi:MAG TPA: hypothetical protein VN613_12925, partial [Gemmatimonadaceae bacterium]|nr:hypothetical protein [Gemmatimonadaceae bacterium]